MTLMDESVWRGKPFAGLGASGTGARFGGTANLEAFTDIRGDITPYPLEI